MVVGGRDHEVRDGATVGPTRTNVRVEGVTDSERCLTSSLSRFITVADTWGAGRFHVVSELMTVHASVERAWHSARFVRPTGAPRPSWLLLAFDDLAALEDADAVACHAVELLRCRVGLVRVALYFVDEGTGLLSGSWGTDLAGGAADEHGLTTPMTDEVREAFQRARGGMRWSLVERAAGEAEASGDPPSAGGGWVAYTPIALGNRPVAIMFNDGGTSGQPVNPHQQNLAALLCTFVGPLLGMRKLSGPPAQGPLVESVVGSLADDPTLTGKILARRNCMSLSRLARVFKLEMGVSLVEYRNRLRLERFFGLMEAGERRDMLNAALDAGFGSYAQFHRVFRSTHGQSPRAFFRTRARARNAQGL